MNKRAIWVLDPIMATPRNRFNLPLIAKIAAPAPVCSTAFPMIGRIIPAVNTEEIFALIAAFWIEADKTSDKKAKFLENLY